MCTWTRRRSRRVRGEGRYFVCRTDMSWWCAATRGADFFIISGRRYTYTRVFYVYTTAIYYTARSRADDRRQCIIMTYIYVLNGRIWSRIIANGRRVTRVWNINFQNTYGRYPRKVYEQLENRAADVIFSTRFITRSQKFDNNNITDWTNARVRSTYLDIAITI